MSEAEAKNFIGDLQTVDSGMPEYIYDERTKSYLCRPGGKGWVAVNEKSFRRHLKGKGYIAYIPKEDVGETTLSQVDAIIEETEMFNRVGYAGPLAGHWSGLKEIAGNPVLITEDPRLIEPEKAESDDPCLPDGQTLCGHDCRGWPILGELIKNLLSHPDCDEIQVERYFGYMAHVLGCLYDRNPMPIIALIIAGEAKSGKTLLFNSLHRVLFGGKIGKPYKYMIGRDTFNDDFLGSVLLTVDDEVNNTHMDARVALGESAKMIVSNAEQKIRGMHKSGFSLNPLWALTIMCNEEPANLMILPPIEEDNKDKFLIFRAYKKPMPMPADTPTERKAFWSTLMQELPKFVHWVRYEWQTPREIMDRWGVRYWHHPHVTDALMKLSPAFVIWEYLERTIFKDANRYPDPRKADEKFWGYEWMGSAAELRGYLADVRHDDDGATPRPRLTMHEARNLPATQWLIKRLTELSRKYPEHVRNVRTNKARYWHIVGPDALESDASDASNEVFAGDQPGA